MFCGTRSVLKVWFGCLTLNSPSPGGQGSSSASRYIVNILNVIINPVMFPFKDTKKESDLSRLLIKHLVLGWIIMVWHTEDSPRCLSGDVQEHRCTEVKNKCTVMIRHDGTWTHLQLLVTHTETGSDVTTEDSAPPIRSLAVRPRSGLLKERRVAGVERLNADAFNNPQHHYDLSEAGSTELFCFHSQTGKHLKRHVYVH